VLALAGGMVFCERCLAAILWYFAGNLFQFKIRFG
jgi:hypothetical protein